MATVRLQDGEVSLYTRGDSKNWYASFRKPGGGRLQESLKTQNKATAKETALARHDEIKWRAKFGMTNKTVSFAEAADAWLLDLEKQVAAGARKNRNVIDYSPVVERYTPREAVDIYERNLQVIVARRLRLGVRSPVLNVLQGRDFAEAHEWFQVAKQYKLEGWSLGGGVGQAGGIGRVLRALLMLRDQQLLDPDYDRCHILMLGKPKWAPLMTAAQLGIRQSCNELFEITYDSSSPYLVAGRYDDYFEEPDLRGDLKKWAIQQHRLPMGVMIGRDGDTKNCAYQFC